MKQGPHHTYRKVGCKKTSSSGVEVISVKKVARLYRGHHHARVNAGGKINAGVIHNPESEAAEPVF